MLKMILSFLILIFISNYVNSFQNSLSLNHKMRINKNFNLNMITPYDIAKVSIETSNIANDATVNTEMINLSQYFMKNLIETAVQWTIPTIALAITAIIFGRIVASSKTKRSRSFNSNNNNNKSSFLGKLGISTNVGDSGSINNMKEYLKIERINDQLDSYLYSIDKAILGDSYTNLNFKRKEFLKKFGNIITNITDEDLQLITKAENEFLLKAKKINNELEEHVAILREISVNDSKNIKNINTKNKNIENKENKENKEEEEVIKKEENIFDKIKNIGSFRKANDIQKKIGNLAILRAQLESKYIREISSVLTDVSKDELSQILSERSGEFSILLNSPLILPMEERIENKSPHTFVLNFPGDVTASQVSNLREEITAILQGAKKDRNDNVILVLNTGGGTVTGYGLAAAQLCRLKEAGIKLTVVVEQVAASGGYMMACTADKIIASPFAVLGSIGVISEQPNVYERLKKEGIEFQTITAGKYKRTLTPFKKPTQEDIKKSQEDIGNILILFKNFVKTNRPKLNIDEVATGETWFGPDALKRNLCDELKTLDDVLLDINNNGGQIYSVKYNPPSNDLKLLRGILGSGGNTNNINYSNIINKLLKRGIKIEDILLSLFMNNNKQNMIENPINNNNNFLDNNNNELLDLINDEDYPNNNNNIDDFFGGFAMDLDATTRYRM